MLAIARARQLLQRRPVAAMAVRSLAQKPFVPDEFEQKYLLKTYNPDGVRGETGLVFTHGKGQYLYDAEGKTSVVATTACIRGPNAL